MGNNGTEPIILDDHEHFVNLLNLKGILQGVVINTLSTTNAFCVNSEKRLSKLSITCTFGLNFKVDIVIFYPRPTPLSSELGDVFQMKIYVHDTDIRDEVRSFTNYLQRQKNFNLAVNVLKKLAVSIGHRKLIIDMLYLNTEGNIVTKTLTDDGIVLICKVHEIKYFMSNWKIHLDYSTHLVMDIIDFTVTRKDNNFYKLVRPIMNLLIHQDLPYNEKVNYWVTIAEAVNVKMKEPVIEIIESDSWNQKDYVLLRNLAEVDNGIMEQYEILEADNEDCQIIED
ncbi:hypothetical protein FQR65_LT06882 [Abscondita terminalis]|nr:hypothetical protein FQR65_LT06882 [Abscondita terminalis]